MNRKEEITKTTHKVLEEYKDTFQALADSDKKQAWQERFENLPYTGKTTKEFIQQELDIQEEINKKYNELLYAVVSKYPDETRHETALRYIKERETIEDIYNHREENENQS